MGGFAVKRGPEDMEHVQLDETHPNAVRSGAMNGTACLSVGPCLIRVVAAQ
jgi:hypothetical protein